MNRNAVTPTQLTTDLGVPRSLTRTSAKADKTARPKVDATAKYGVIKAIAQALTRKSMPPMDERLKSIVASQIGALLKGGWPADEIQHAAIELALAWDSMRGHNRLTHLAARLRAADAARREAEHHERMRIERQELAGKAEPGATLRHPNLHDFVSDGTGSCSLCSGPIGVHVRPRIDTRDDDEIARATELESVARKER